MATTTGTATEEDLLRTPTLREYLIALYLEPSARTPRRRERAALLLELPGLNRPMLDEILARHGISF
jgi:hypothetical protein